jgi:hypothetical protein
VSDEPEPEVERPEIDYGPAYFAPAPEPHRQAPAHVDLAASYDALWRKQPRVPGFIQFARSFPGYAALYTRRVPDQFVAMVSIDEVDVACPCGETPRCRWNVPEECACNRVFAYFAGTVWVAYVQELEPVVD